VCTVVTRHIPGEPLRILALRDEFIGRDFDEPGEWWPEQPDVVGGRDRQAGGTWCASALGDGRTALLLNRIERREGSPSRGVLPLAALAHGSEWTREVDHHDMAAFNLVLAGPEGVRVWIWDATDLRRVDLPDGIHMITSAGVDAADPKTERFGPRFAVEDWLGIVTRCVPSAVPGSLVVRVPIEGRVYATVFGQLIVQTPGELRVEHSRTPWHTDDWRAVVFSTSG
jgi:uncharacterized protein with NRDE domain